MKKLVCALAALALAVPLASCGQSAADKKAAESSSAPGKIQVKSCDETLTFDKAPERVLVLSDTDVSILDDLDLLDKIVARAGEPKIKEVKPQLQAKLEKIKRIEAGDTGSGGAAVSTESVLDLNADLVIGFDKGADRKALAAAGVPLYSPDAFCPNYNVKKASFDLVNDEVDKIATMFGVEDKAKEVKEQVNSKVEKLKGDSPAAGQTAVALYITPGSKTFKAYNASSMVEPIFEANGLKNVYADGPKRVFEISMEDLLAKDPDWVVLLSGNPEAGPALDTFAGFEGASDMKASKNKQVVHLPFVLTDPPTTLSVDGASALADRLQK